MLWMAGSAATTIVVVTAITLFPLPTMIDLAVLVAAALLAWRPHWSVFGVMLLGVTALPQFVPTTVVVGGLQVYLYEPLLVVALGWAASQPVPGYVWGRAGVFGAIFAFAMLLGITSNAPPAQVLVDPRGLLDMLLIYIVAAAVICHAALAASVLRLLRGILWWSAGLTLVASLTGLELRGLAEDASLFLNGAAQQTGATRIVTSATHLSLAVLCGCTALLLTRRATMRGLASYAAPALLVVFLSFSRNSLVALAAVVLMSLLLYARSWWGAVVALTKVGAIALVAALVLLGLRQADIPLGTYALDQASGYGQRVLAGLTTTAFSLDASVQYRVLENYYLWQSIDASPIFGHGFGFAYKPAFGVPGSFTATAGQWYAHNFYLWLWVKAGLVGLLAFAWWAVTPLTALRRGDATTVALGMAGIGLLVVSFIAPMPLSANGNLVLGAALGAVAAIRAQQLAARRARPDFQRA